MRMGAIAFLLLTALAIDTLEISGIVENDSGYVGGAIIRVQGTGVSSTTDAWGRFKIKDLPASSFVSLTAFAPGYYIAGPVLVRAGDSNVIFRLRKIPRDDNESYEWVSALSSDGKDLNCQNCHGLAPEADSLLPFDEWLLDAHGTAAQNRRFLSIYNGTDLSGLNRSPLTRYVFNRDYGKVPLPPDPSQPYFGPGFKLDFPNSTGNCAACHLPAAAVGAPYDTDPNTVFGVGREGVACDVCHKLWSVRLQSSTDLPYPNTPGVLSMDFRRPPTGQQLFLGPYDNVAPGDDTYSPLQNQGQFCAPCHFGQFWGVQVYNSFGEWLDSPYSDPINGRTCQDCHMPRRGANAIARPEKGALLRDASAVFSHLMPGASNVALLRDTASLNLRVTRKGYILHVQVTVVNEKAGHHIPTDHPARNILLVVSATDSSGQPLEMLSGPIIPEWGGRGEDPNDYAGQPGRGYAKVLEELWTEVSPTAAYWNPTVVREDTRIPAFGQDVSEYEFVAPFKEAAKVTAQLVFRRAFRTLATQKSWDTGDILMIRATRMVPGSNPVASPPP
jgi:hypothetical protein